MAGSKTRTDRENDGEGLVSRWSRLKGEARDGVPAAAETAGADEPAEAAAVPEAPEPPVAVGDLPDVDTLTYESDFTAFLREGVPEELQRLALRKLWRSDPVLANVDGLNDYDLDYRVLGVDTRVTEALLAQREVKERLLRGGDDIHQRPRAVEAARPPAPAGEAAPAEEAANTAPQPAGEQDEEQLASEPAEDAGEKA